MHRHRFAILLGALTLLLLSAPIVSVLGPGLYPGLSRMTMTAMFTLMLLSAVFAVCESRVTAIIALSLAVPAVCLQALSLLVDREGVVVAMYVLDILFLGYTVVVILRFLFATDRVTPNTIWASVCVYLLLGVLWSGIYSVLDILDSRSFTFTVATDGESELMRLGTEESIVPLYYSFVTMTTLGYGDIVPTSPVARMFAAVEALTAQIYLIVLVARMVGLHISQATFHRGASIVLLALLAGCGQSDKAVHPDAGKPPHAAEKGYTIGMSQCNLEEPWRVQMNADIKAAAAKHPTLKVIFENAENDTPKQCTQIEQFISDGVDLIIISPNEVQPLTGPVAKAFDAGIPVIVLDRPLIGQKYTCFIGVDNKKIGRAAGLWLANRLGGKGKIVELKGLMTSAPAQDRHSGFRSAIRDPGYRVIFEAGTNWSEEKARKEMASALSRFDEIDAVYAHNDPAAHGAYLATKAAGREKDIIFVGIDALPQEGVAYVKQGILDACFQNPTGGAEAIDVALKILEGQQVPKTITLGSRVFTKENVGRGGEAIE